MSLAVVMRYKEVRPIRKSNNNMLLLSFQFHLSYFVPGRVEQLVGHLTRKSGVLGSIPGLATYFRFSFRFLYARLKNGRIMLYPLASVCLSVRPSVNFFVSV